MSDIRVSYNNSYRILLNIKHRLSISETFVRNHILTFDSKLRAARAGFYLRLNRSTNTLVCSTLSDYVRD